MTGDCRSGDLIEQFLDATWLESGLSANTLAAYRSDLSAFNKSNRCGDYFPADVQGR